MKLYDHQVTISKEIQTILSEHSVAILSLPERSGKTLTAIDAIVTLSFKAPLWVTKKVAIIGIEKDLKSYGADNFTVTNYESLHKLNSKHDVIILDEFHTCGAYPKPPQRIKQLRRFKGAPFLLISATPASESASQWFHPLWITPHQFSRYGNFYAWAKEYVNVNQKRAGVHIVNDYSGAKEDYVMSQIKPYLVQRSRDELGFEFQPTLQLHTVSLENDTKQKIQTLKRDKVLDDYLADTPTKLMNAIYQVECGTLKDGDTYRDMGNNEVLEYIKNTWGDSDNMAIMTHWVGQREIFEREFKHALILSSTSHAEGLDLAHIDNLIIASMDYSTARFQQRNARQSAKHRKTPIVVHIITTDGGISRRVYEAVAVKHVNFTARMALSA